MANRFLSNITINDSYTFPSADGEAGQIITTDGSGNLSFTDISSLNGAQSNFVYYTVKNSTGGTLNKGTAVRAVGTDGNSGHILINKMIADGSVEPKYFMGVLESTLGNGDIGRVIHFGELDQFNTSTFQDGDVLWCDPATPGGFTTTEPLGPNLKLAAAIVINASTNGKIKIRVQGNAGLHELHDVKITTQADGEILVWDNTTGVWMNDGTLTVDYTNGRVGIGTISPDALLRIDQDASATALKVTGGGTGIPIAEFLRDVGATASVRIHGSSAHPTVQMASTANTFSLGVNNTSFQICDNDNLTANARLVIDSSGNVGIGTTSPIGKLNINTGASGNAVDIVNQASGTISFANGSGGTAVPNIISKSSNNLGLNIVSAVPNVPAAGMDMQFDVRETDNTDFATLTSTAFRFARAGNSLVEIKRDGKVGIGTTSPSEKLDVSGNAAISGNLKLNGVIYHDTDTSGTISSGVWYRIIEISGGSGRGKCDFTIDSGGGSGTPFTLKATVNTNWANSGSTIVCHFNSYGSGVRDLRVVRNSTSNKSFIDVRFSGGEDNVVVRIQPTVNAAAATVDFTNVTTLPTGDSVETTLDVNGKVFSTTSSQASDNFVITYDNKLGVGTTSPSAKLHVVGDIQTSTRYLINTGTTGQTMAIGYWDGSNARIEAGSALPMLITSYQGNINLGISGGTTMTVKSTGVGIGTTSPGYKLHVNGDAYFTDTIGVNGEGNGITVDTNYGNNGRVGLMKYGGYEGMLTSGSNTKIRLGHRTDSYYVATSGTPTLQVDMEISPSGDVSMYKGTLNLGTDSVASSINSVGDLFILNVDSNNNTGGTPNFRFRIGSATDISTIDSTGIYLHGNAKYFTATESTNNYKAVELGADSSGDGNFIMRNSSNNVRVKLYAEEGAYNYIDNGGNFGIGYTTPTYKLDVNGTVGANRFVSGTSSTGPQMALSYIDQNKRIFNINRAFTFTGAGVYYFNLVFASQGGFGFDVTMITARNSNYRNFGMIKDSGYIYWEADGDFVQHVQGESSISSTYNGGIYLDALPTTFGANNTTDTSAGTLNYSYYIKRYAIYLPDNTTGSDGFFRVTVETHSYTGDSVYFLNA